MARISSVTVCGIAAAALAVVTGAGCRLIPRSGPVPQEVADARRLCNEGLSAADRKDLLRAEGLLEEAVKNCPTDVDARRHYADVLWQRGERMAAVTQIAEALRLSPGDTSLCIDGGRMYMELGLLDDADRLSREAVRVAPRSEKAWRLHGQVALARGRPEEALADYHRALAIAPDDRELILDTAEIYRRLGRPQRALATLAILGESYPPNQTPPQVLALEGMAQEALDRPTDAIESYRQAVARGLESQDVVTRLAKLEQAAAEDRSQTAVAEAPVGGNRQ
jgi:tetratricopeptide (TPR) repeat protein